MPAAGLAATGCSGHRKGKEDSTSSSFSLRVEGFHKQTLAPKPGSPDFGKLAGHAEVGVGVDREGLLVPFLSSLSDAIDSSSLHPAWPPGLQRAKLPQEAASPKPWIASCFALGGERGCPYCVQEWTISVRPLCTPQFWNLVLILEDHSTRSPSTSSRKPS